MIFQKVLKGISGIGKSEAEHIMETGILSNWYRKMGTISEEEINQELNEPAVVNHLNDYANPLPVGHSKLKLGATYGEVTPFISTSAGVLTAFR